MTKVIEIGELGEFIRWCENIAAGYEVSPDINGQDQTWARWLGKLGRLVQAELDERPIAAPVRSTPTPPPKEPEWEVKSYEGLKRIVIDLETTPKQHKAISEAIEALCTFVFDNGDVVVLGDVIRLTHKARKLLEKK